MHSIHLGWTQGSVKLQFLPGGGRVFVHRSLSCFESQWSPRCHWPCKLFLLIKISGFLWTTYHQRSTSNHGNPWTLCSRGCYWCVAFNDLILQVKYVTIVLSIFTACLIEAQLHNASQLEGWCFSYIANHYGDVCRKHPKEFKMLSPATHRSLNQQRWPPIWYLIENDWYEKAKREMDQQDKTKHALKSVVKKKKCHCL